MNNITPLLHSIGSFQLVQQSKVKATDVSEKSLNQLVSYVDIESEKMLVEGLLKITPNAGFLTEEGTSTLKNKDLYWIIDPIDGTTNYLFGHTKFCISIALYEMGNPVYAAIYVPADNEFFYADNSGAYLNNTKIEVSTRSVLCKTLIATGFPYYNFTEIDSYIAVLKYLMKSTQGLRRMGSAAIDLAYTACGRFDAFFELNLSPWDVAGGAYIVQQAGGLATDFNLQNNYVFGNSIVAGSVFAHQKLTQIIANEDF